MEESLFVLTVALGFIFFPLCDFYVTELKTFHSTLKHNTFFFLSQMIITEFTWFSTQGTCYAEAVTLKIANIFTSLPLCIYGLSVSGRSFSTSKSEAKSWKQVFLRDILSLHLGNVFFLPHPDLDGAEPSANKRFLCSSSPNSLVFR